MVERRHQTLDCRISSLVTLMADIMGPSMPLLSAHRSTVASMCHASCMTEYHPRCIMQPSRDVHKLTATALVSTTEQLSLEPRSWEAPTHDAIHERRRVDLRDPIYIPLPPSSTVSEKDEPRASSRASSDQGAKQSIEELEEAKEHSKTALVSPVAESQPIEDAGAWNHAQEMSRRSGPSLLEGDSLADDIEDHHGRNRLAQLLQEMSTEEYERRRCQSTQIHVQDLLYTYGTNAKLIPLRTYVYGSLMDSFQHDRKSSFASVYTQSSRSLDVRPSSSPVAGGHARRESWMDQLPSETMMTVLDLLSHLRTVPNFLAQRISSLSSAQLHHLTLPHRQRSNAESILQPVSMYKRFDFRTASKLVAKSTEALPVVDEMKGDPMLLLFHSLFDASSMSLAERELQLHAWSTTCAQIIADAKPESVDFCLVVTNAFADVRSWSLLPQLEMFMLDQIRQGAFLLDQDTTTVDCAKSPELRNAEMVVATSRFFDRTIEGLLEVLVSKQHDPLPPDVLRFIRSTLARIENVEQRMRARNFFISRWYCSTFIHELLVAPEVSFFDGCTSPPDKSIVLRYLHEVPPQ